VGCLTGLNDISVYAITFGPEQELGAIRDAPMIAK
jgi:hypothetical protein